MNVWQLNNIDLVAESADVREARLQQMSIVNDWPMNRMKREK